MKRKSFLPVLLVTMLIFLNGFLVVTGQLHWFAELIFSCSPLLIGWMVWKVLRDPDPGYPSFREGQEWGDADVEK